MHFYSLLSVISQLSINAVDKTFRGMFYVELNPGEDADEEDVISQSIKEIHQVKTQHSRNFKVLENPEKIIFLCKKCVNVL